eukprot:3949183-Amphidinium_carterae.2
MSNLQMKVNFSPPQTFSVSWVTPLALPSIGLLNDLQRVGRSCPYCTMLEFSTHMLSVGKGTSINDEKTSLAK